MTDWKSMDSAPKDGQWLLGYVPLGIPEWQPIRWLEEHPAKHNGETVRSAGWYSDGNDRDRPVSPVNWSPPPSLP